MKILAISIYAPYDNVDHGGGKLHNYNIKLLTKECDLKIITFARRDELEYLDFDKYGIDNIVLSFDNNFITIFLRKLGNFFKRIFFFGETGGFYTPLFKYKTLKQLRILKRNGYRPDRIYLEWTQTLLLIPYIQKIFPDIKYISLEHDISFQSYYRQYLNKKTIFSKIKWFIKYTQLKKIELFCIKKCDSIIVLSEKDKKLLTDNSITPKKIVTIIPYFDKYYAVKHENIYEKKIIFFGAMSRPENYMSVIWFIENVFYRLDNSYFLYIIGGNPSVYLNKYTSTNIQITGFVNNLESYFQNCLCMVAPLLFGAGIKIKILEGFSAGITILTNDIGIEGIPAVNGRDYFHCSLPEDYIRTINELAENIELCHRIGFNARKFIQTQFDYENKYTIFKSTVLG